MSRTLGEKSNEIERLLLLMKALSETPETLAERVNVSARTINNYIWGDKPLGGPLLRGLFDECGVSLDWLLNGQGEMFRDEPIAMQRPAPLIGFLETIDSSSLQDFWRLCARAAEESLMESGAVPGVDYARLDLYRLAQPLVAAKWAEGVLVLQSFEAAGK